MKPEDLLNADIRLIDPRYDRRWNYDIYTEPELGFGCLGSDGIYVVRIPKGWDLLQQVRRSRFQHNFSLPTHNPKSSLMDRFLINQIEEIEMSRADFGHVVLDFINEVVFGRLETGVCSAEDYLAMKQDMPLNGCVGNGGSGTSPHYARVNNARRFEEDIERVICESPHTLGLPGRPQKIYKEVRLDTRLARCIVRHSEFGSVFIRDAPPCYALTICDYVLQYSSHFCVVEVKYGNMSKRINGGITPREKTIRQLCDASTFLHNNFGESPSLVRVHGKGGRLHSWRTEYEHFRYAGGKLTPLKLEKLLIPKSKPSVSSEVA